MSWDTGVSDLRTLLSDGPEDRYNYRKRCFGEINGLNTRFKTFEFRRVTDFTLDQGVFIDGEAVSASDVTSDDVKTGEFVLVNPPEDGSVVEASYYSQWFLDSELDQFLQVAGLWLNSSNDYAQTAGGLIPAALKYAASEAYLKQAQRWRSFLSQGFKVEDAPNKDGTGPVDSFIKMAETFREEAVKSRDEYFTRQGRNLQPLFGTVVGRVRRMP